MIFYQSMRLTRMNLSYPIASLLPGDKSTRVSSKEPRVIAPSSSHVSHQPPLANSRRGREVDVNLGGSPAASSVATSGQRSRAGSVTPARAPAQSFYLYRPPAEQKSFHQKNQTGTLAHTRHLPVVQSPAMARRRLDFPAPDSPTMSIRSDSPRANVRPSMSTRPPAEGFRDHAHHKPRAINHKPQALLASLTLPGFLRTRSFLCERTPHSEATK